MGAFIETWCIVRPQWIFRPNWLVVRCMCELVAVDFILGRWLYVDFLCKNFSWPAVSTKLLILQLSKLLMEIWALNVGLRVHQCFRRQTSVSSSCLAATIIRPCTLQVVTGRATKSDLVTFDLCGVCHRIPSVYQVLVRIPSGSEDYGWFPVTA